VSFPFLPLIGQITTVECGTETITGTLVCLKEQECTIRLGNGDERAFPLSAIRTATANLLTREDVLKHLADSGDARHCDTCYLAMLYAVDLLAKTFQAQCFAARSDLIQEGVGQLPGARFRDSSLFPFPTGRRHPVPDTS
jgi:hypothetical protein